MKLEEEAKSEPTAPAPNAACSSWDGLPSALASQILSFLPEPRPTLTGIDLLIPPPSRLTLVRLRVPRLLWGMLSRNRLNLLPHPMVDTPLKALHWTLLFPLKWLALCLLCLMLLHVVEMCGVPSEKMMGLIVPSLPRILVAILFVSALMVTRRDVCKN